MIVLDENVFESQRVQLRRWRIRSCQIGDELGRQGMQDEEIIPLLRTLRHPTFVTRDADFFDRSLCADHYCLVYFRIHPLEIATHVRRLLHHPAFRTWSQRQGRVLRITTSGIWSWEIHQPRIARHRWVD